MIFAVIYKKGNKTFKHHKICIYKLVSSSIKSESSPAARAEIDLLVVHKIVDQNL